MGLPETVRVKLSSEAAGDIALTAVVQQEMRLAELVEMMLGVAGKDVDRVHELLRRGTLVSGASRLRWAGWDAARDELAALLSTFPESDPGRAFSWQACVRAVLKGPQARIEIERETGEARRLFRRGSFWDALMELASAAAPQYVDYSYKHRTDRYEIALAPEAAARLRERAAALRYTRLETQVRAAVIHAVEFHVTRG